MNNDLFAEFSAQFDKPEETLLEQRERIQKEQGITNKPATIKASDLTDEEIKKRRLEAGFLSNETEKKFFDQANQVISVERYASMPEGLKEAQERNGVRDHGLGLKKGDFVWADKKKKDKVIFKESDTGAFSVLDPDNPNEATKDLLDRKFPGADYVGSNNEVNYVCGVDPISIQESDNGTINILNKEGNMLFSRPASMPFEDQLQSILPFFKVDKLVEKKEEPLGFEIEIPEVQGEIKFNEPQLRHINPSSEPIRNDGMLDLTKQHTGEEVKNSNGFFEQKTVSTSELKAIAEAVNKPKFGRQRFAKPPLAEGEAPKNKINAIKIEEHGIVFDSKIENFMYNLLISENIRFEFQKEFVLQESFVYMHENILPVKIIIDFFFLDYPVMADTKGMMMDHTKIKHKMLKEYLHKQGTEYRILLPSSQKKCRELIDHLRNGFILDEPLTEHAATARKNKLKKQKFEWVEGYWIKGDQKYLAAWIMKLPKYDFEELLIRSNAAPTKEVAPEITFPENFNEEKMVWTASVAVDKGYDYETLRYSDYMNGFESLTEQVYDYVLECKEIGTAAFYEKYKHFNLY